MRKKTSTQKKANFMYRNKRISSSTQSKTTSKLEEYWLPRKATRSKSRFYIKEANSIQGKVLSKFTSIILMKAGLHSNTK